MDPPKRFWIFRCLFDVIAVLAVIAFFYWLHGFNKEINSKAEWGALQNIEYTWRGKNFVSLQTIDDPPYHIVGVKSSRGTKIWILLNAEDAPLYKTMPQDEDFILSEADYDRIKDTGFASEAVLTRLHSHVSH